jgi:hypothetical protein
MIMNDRRKAATMIVDHMPKYAEGGDVEAPDDGGDDGEALAHEFVSAVHAKDAAGTWAAFKAMFAACELSPHEEYGDDVG